MSSPYSNTMSRLAISGELAADTLNRAVANLAVSCAIAPALMHGNRNEDQRRVAPQPLKENVHLSVNSASHESMSRITDLGHFIPVDPKIRRGPVASSVKPSPSSEQDIPHSALTYRDLESHDSDSELDASCYASTGIGSDAESLTTGHRKGHQVSFRQSGKMLSGTDHTMKMMAYHMGQISFGCECHFQDIPLSEMSKADKRHCRRFHKGLIGRKKAGEKRKKGE